MTLDYPVLSAGPTPHTPLPEWTFSITRGGDTLKSWTWQEMQALPAEELRVGDQLELRGPIGGYFVWEPADHSPVMLIAGGSGVVPLRSMLRHRQLVGSDVPAPAAGQPGGQSDVAFVVLPAAWS